MPFPFGGAAQVFRDLEAGSAHKPSKAEIRALGADVEGRIEGLESRPGMVMISGDHTIDRDDYSRIHHVSGGNWTLTFPDASELGNGWGIGVVFQGGTGAMTPFAGQTINGKPVLTGQDGMRGMVVSDGSHLRFFADDAYREYTDHLGASVVLNHASHQSPLFYEVAHTRQVVLASGETASFDFVAEGSIWGGGSTGNGDRQISAQLIVEKDAVNQGVVGGQVYVQVEKSGVVNEGYIFLSPMTQYLATGPGTFTFKLRLWMSGFSSGNTSQFLDGRINIRRSSDV